ncbi:Extracellular matrix-binding ebh, putative [Babesia ovata]|uniref:Extracellular matrix-binding ebh, putative n=1 Tax=Babesia ovata TaxID=189622 RepID=A0A2H6K7C5_9APIC|nr:Extracellular matrix-binding ebh, putative [Babesia ovata]GBE58907.1 Extracellular matrix-binding ebh, putative [Babesia ovata]
MLLRPPPKKALKAPTNSTGQANEKHKIHFYSLNSWIETAESIRKAAWSKAEEAYSKLDVHADLSRNVEKIVKTKDENVRVHKGLNGLHGNMGDLNQQVRTVLTGAVKKAEEVYKGLEDKDDKVHPVGKNIEAINKANKEIANANKTLGTEVQHLGKWRSAAHNVIDKANEKCEEILKRVSTDKNVKEAVIYEQAETLKDKGTELYNAAKLAKQQVGELVGEALQGVVEMDGDLKRDLRTVREEIKEGIQKVIKDLGVNDLGEKVQNDLGALKGKMSDLARDDNVNNLVSKELQGLSTAKTQLINVTNPIKTHTDQLESKFQSAIQHPLKSKVGEVDSAIGELGGVFNDVGRAGPKDIQGIFRHIKDRVGEIKGEEGESESWYLKGGSGLLGIESAINHYAGNFEGDDNFNKRVQGWLNGIWGEKKDGQEVNKVLQAWLQQWVESKGVKWNSVGGRGTIMGGKSYMDIFREKIIENIGEKFTAEAQTAGGVVTKERSGAPPSIQKDVEAVKKGCEEFVSKLDEKLHSSRLDSLASAIAGKVHGEVKSKLQGSTTEEHIKLLVEASLVALRATVNQVADELDSVLLADYRMGGQDTGMHIAKALDKALSVTKMLQNKLTKATTSDPGKPLVPPSPGQPESPAQAVDSKLQAVKQEVQGLEEDFRGNVTRVLRDTAG